MKLSSVQHYGKEVKLELTGVENENPEMMEDWYYILGKEFLAKWIQLRGNQFVDESDIDTLIKKYFPEIFV